MRYLITTVMLMLASSYAYGASGNQKVRAMLNSNSIVKAALVEAKQFSGAKTCEYDVKATASPEFEQGSAFDYSAEISCSKDEATAIIRVTGRLLAEGPQALTLTIDFAG